MRNREVFIITIIIGLIQLGCATTVYNPFKIDQDKFFSKTTTVALLPITLPEGVEDPEPVKAKFESLIEAKLHEAGLSIVKSKETDAVWNQMKEQMGGFFDPITGKIDEEKKKSAKEHARRELNMKFNADAVLIPSIQIVNAQFDGGWAKWNGVQESIALGSPWSLSAFLGMTGAYSGTVGALSLVVFMEDIDGVEMYFNAGGIQVLQKLSFGKFVSVPENEFFVNEERNSSAVNIALGPLVKKTVPTEASKEKL